MGTRELQQTIETAWQRRAELSASSVDEATRYFCEHSGGGEIVVLRASGRGEYKRFRSRIYLFYKYNSVHDRA